MEAEKEIKPGKGRGGKRPGSGRKPDYFKRLGITPVNAAQILARYDEPKLWDWLLKHSAAPYRFKALQYLTDRRDGRPKQAVELTGALTHTQAPYRDPRLANLSPEELANLDSPTRKLATTAQDGPHNQVESKPEIEADELVEVATVTYDPAEASNQQEAGTR